MTHSKNSLNLHNNITLDAISENAILLRWPEKICTQQHQNILCCQHLLQQSLAQYCIDSIVSYASLLIRYDNSHVSIAQLKQHVSNALLLIDQEKTTNNSSQKEQEVVEIPVYYGEEVAWDMPALSEQLDISADAIIKLHSQCAYHAFAQGFTPGFCYLATLPKVLQVPRLSSPRVKVPRGAVAIAEQQTAIYPNESPGGWHIIGRTPTPMYTIEQHSSNTPDNAITFVPTISVGQQVKFQAISKREYLALGGIL